MAFTRLEPTGVNTSATFTFANANVTTNLNVGGVSDLGPVGNIIITGGTSGYVLSTDGSGTLSWVAQSGGGGGTNYSNANVAAYLPTFTGNFTAGNISTTGNITAAYFIGNGSTLSSINGANVSGEVTFAATANSVAGGNVSGQVANALVAGTVYTNAQPNITSLGTLANLTVSGVSNLGYNQVGEVLKLSNSASAADKWLTFKNLYGEFQIGTQGNTGAYLYNFANSPIDFYTGAVKYFSIDNTGETQVLSTTDASSKTTGALQVSGGVGITGNVYANYYFGNADSLSGTIANANYATFAGTVITNAQPNITSVGTLNGITVTGTANYIGASNVSLGPVGNVKITGGTSGYVLSTDGSGTLSWVAQAAGGGSNISNGTSNVNIATSGGNVTTSVGGNANIVVVTGTGANVNGYLTVSGSLSAGSGTGGSISGANNISANYFTGNGVYLSGLTGANVSGYVPLATNANTVTTAAQPNITSLGTLVDANISGNLLIGGNLNVNGAVEYTNVTNLYVKDPIIEVGGNANAGALSSNDGKDRGILLHYYTTTPVDAFMGWDNSAGEFALGSNVTLSNEVATFNNYGNLRVGNIIGNGQALTSITGGNVSGQVGNALVAGTVYTNAQPNITSVGTLASLTVSGLLTATGGGVKTGNIIDSTGTNTLSISSTTSEFVGNLTVGSGGTGWVSASNFSGSGNTLTNLNASNIASGTIPSSILGNSTVYIGTTSIALNRSSGAQSLTGITSIDGYASTVSGAAQSNITSVGTLNGITVTGTANYIGASNVSLGPVGNVKITGGSANYVLSTDGSGTLSWVAQSGGGGGGVTITDDTTTNSTYYPVFTTTTSGSMSTANVSTSKLYFNPSTGTLSATLIQTLSDADKKTNLEPITNALEKLLQLSGYTFTMIDSNEPSAGLLAQDALKVLPEVVKWDDVNKNYTLNYNGIIGLLVEAVKSQQETIDDLSNVVKTLTLR